MTKHTKLLGMVLGSLVVLTAVPAWADLELPAPSLAAKVTQRVGLTDVTVDYSSPAAKGRKIWGDVVPFDKPWRTGANAATKITFSRDVTFGGAAVPTGTYSVVTLPSEKGWTVMLNKDLKLSVADQKYDAKDELVRVKATTSAIPARERMTFIFANTTDNDTSLDLEWDKLRISVPIKADTTAQALANIKNALDNAWRPHASAARYTSETLKDYPTALKYADASIAIQSTWSNNWTKAEILAHQNNFAEARKYAQIAWDMGQKDPNFYMKDMIKKVLVDWKDKK